MLFNNNQVLSDRQKYESKPRKQESEYKPKKEKPKVINHYRQYNYLMNDPEGY